MKRRHETDACGLLISTFCLGIATTAFAAGPTAHNQDATAGTGRTIRIIADYEDSDSAPKDMTLAVVSQPTHGTVEHARTYFYYTPETGHMGQDSFQWRISDGVATSETATCSITVTNTPPGGPDTVLLIVKNTVYAELVPELDRLKTDLEWEGRTVKIQQWSSTAALDLWNHLVSEYTNASQHLEGAILIGELPMSTGSVCPYSGSSHTTDLIYWNMSTWQNSTLRHIWVSRFKGDVSFVYDQAGWEVPLLERALQANHDYRMGASRLPHTACNYVAGDLIDWQPMETANMLDAWPVAQACPPKNAMIQGCELVHETAHGEPERYDWSQANPVIAYPGGLHTHLCQARFTLLTSCKSGQPGCIANNQLLTRGGGNVLTIAASTTTYTGAFDMQSSYGNDPLLRGRLGEGVCWGNALIPYYTAFGDRYRAMFYGDLSLPAMTAPANVLPTVNTLTASVVNVHHDVPVTFGVTISDPDSGANDSPYADYEHRIEWFMKGYNDGKNEPTLVTDSTQTNWTQATYSFTNTGTFKVRAEVCDEWLARHYREITVTVYTTPPVASNDVATTAEDTPVTINVLTNDPAVLILTAGIRV